MKLLYTHHIDKEQFVHLLYVILIGHIWFLTYRAVEVLHPLLQDDHLKLALETLLAE